MENNDANEYEIMRKIQGKIHDLYYDSDRHWEGLARLYDVLGNPSIFYKLDWKVINSTELVCSRCGKWGRLKEKTTIVKRKYKYRKLYVYHSIYHSLIDLKSSQPGIAREWCYLNEKELASPVVTKTFQRCSRAANIRKWFYKSVVLPE